MPRNLLALWQYPPTFGRYNRDVVVVPVPHDRSILALIFGFVTFGMGDHATNSVPSTQWPNTAMPYLVSNISFVPLGGGSSSGSSHSETRAVAILAIG